MREGEPLDGVLYCSPSHVSQPVLELQQLLQRENVDACTPHVQTHRRTHDKAGGTGRHQQRFTWGELTCQRLKDREISTLFLPPTLNPEAPRHHLCLPDQRGRDRRWWGLHQPRGNQAEWEGSPQTEGQGVPHSSPSQRRCVCWGSVLGEQGSEAEGKGSFGFRGRPVGEKMPQTGFQDPGAQLLNPPPIAASQRNPEVLQVREEKHCLSSSCLFCSSRTKPVPNQPQKESQNQ